MTKKVSAEKNKKKLEVTKKHSAVHSNVKESRLKNLPAPKKPSSMKKFTSHKFCPKCGSPILKGTFCRDCDTPDFKFKDIHFTICNSCRKYLHKSKWAKYSSIDMMIKDVAKDFIHAKVSISHLSEYDNEKILLHKAGIKTEISLEIKHKGNIYDIPAKLEVTLCPLCSKKGTKYFEGIIQLRNASPEALFFVKNDLHKMRKKGIYLNKEVHYNEKDSDLYVTDQSYARTIAEKTRRHFGGTVKKNAQLFSKDWQTAKDIFRLNILLELPVYSKGDVIKKDNALYKVVSMDSKVHVMNMKTGKKKLIPHDTSYIVLKPYYFKS
jgi:NMD protein affecting ribosome stability and mRNA decay